MSEHSAGSQGGSSGDNPSETGPRALVHRKILDVAADDPEATIPEIADRVSGASPTFVERVIDQYGDPATGSQLTERTDDRASETENETAGGSVQTEVDRPGEQTQDVAMEGSDSTESGADTSEQGETAAAVTDGKGARDDADEREPLDQDEDGSTVPDISELSEKQRETLKTVASRPQATQSEIADELGVSRATVSKRLTSIEGFEWATREVFVDRLFNFRGGTPQVESSDEYGSNTEAESVRVADLDDRLAAVEERLDADSGSSNDGEGDPELVHKVVHACMDAEYISRDEELEIIGRVIECSRSEP